MGTGTPPQVILIAGPNGAGKSTLAPFLLRDRLKLTQYVNADTIAQGLSAFAPESVAFEAGRVMLNRLHGLAAQRKSFSFETTLATRSYAGWLRKLRQEGYEVHLFFLWLRSVEVALERVKERVRAGGHDVPAEVVRRRYRSGAKNFFGLYRKLVNTWAVYDHSVTSAPIPLAAGQEPMVETVFDAPLWRHFCEAGK